LYYADNVVKQTAEFFHLPGELSGQMIENLALIEQNSRFFRHTQQLEVHSMFEHLIRPRACYQKSVGLRDGRKVFHDIAGGQSLHVQISPRKAPLGSEI
jgi:hypothetical protein